jgi:tRNA(Ile)-lysidine synthetase-like protein
MEHDYTPLLKFWFSVDNLSNKKSEVYSTNSPEETKSTQCIPCFWFSKKKETDDYIKEHYSELLTLAENHKLNYWKSTVHGHLALIILLDQFSRHIYRDNSKNIYKNDIIAYHYAKEFIIENRDEKLTNLEKMMILLPFRHQENITAYNFVIDYISKEKDPIWDNFKKHTMRNYEYLLKHNKLPNRIDSHINYINNDKFISILEHGWVSDIQTDKIVSNVSETLIKYVFANLESDSNLIIVSLSGGVDSVVILAILAIMKIVSPRDLTVVAVHLDYHNREETGLEAEFLFRWCEMINIPLYYRYIYEGCRERNNKREEYEELTKKIRFDMYKKVQDLYSDHHKIGVILGHHKGDLQENVFFNLMKGRTLTDLSVIKEQSEIMGVKILRPLLSVTKKEIFDIAHLNNFPYFKNTTPSWSNRGKYREIIQPAIIDTFGEGVLTNLSKVSQESDELQLIIKKNIIIPYIESIIVKDNLHYLPKTKDQPFSYWKYIFQEFCHKYRLASITHKSLKQIYEKLYSSSSSNITVSNNISITINEDQIILLLK